MTLEYSWFNANYCRLEHRYYGQSSPYDSLTAKTLQYLTLDNAIADNIYFARTVSLPFDATNSSQASRAPWVFSGGSYSGALSAWTEKLSPGTFWAYHSSSAPVQAISDYVRDQRLRNTSFHLTFIVAILCARSTRNAKELQQRHLFGL